MNECQNCANLQEQVNRLQIENQKLQREILRLKRIIDAAEALCAMVAMEAQIILVKSNPKGVWAFNKGKKEAADRIGAALYY